MIYDSRPDIFENPLEVSGCIIYDDNKNILLLERNMNKIEGGKWGAPGGKIDPGESPTSCCIREVYEETGLQYSEAELFHLKTFYVYTEFNGRNLIYHEFIAKYNGGNISLRSDEHTLSNWFSQDNLKNLPLIHDMEACLEEFFNFIGKTSSS